MKFFLLLILFSLPAKAQVNRFWDNPSAYPADLNRAWIETQGNCSSNNQAAISIVRSRSSTLSMEERGMPLSEMLNFMLTTPNFPNVNSLDLRNVSFSSDDLIQLNKLVPRMTNVTDLYLGGSVISDKRMLVNYVLSNLSKNLQILDLSGLNLDANDAKMLSGVIGNMRNLKVLYLGNNQFGDEGFNALVNYAFNTLRNLRILSLQNNHLSDASLNRFAMSSMSLMTNLQILDLKGNKINSDTTKKLVRTSIFLPQLTVLDLGSDLSKLGQKQISSFIKCSTYSSGVFADPIK